MSARALFHASNSPRLRANRLPCQSAGFDYQIVTLGAESFDYCETLTPRAEVALPEVFQYVLERIPKVFVSGATIWKASLTLSNAT
jgi:hypothetical protein